MYQGFLSAGDRNETPNWDNCRPNHGPQFCVENWADSVLREDRMRLWLQQIHEELVGAGDIANGAIAQCQATMNIRAGESDKAYWQRSMTMMEYFYNIQIRGLNLYIEAQRYNVWKLAGMPVGDRPEDVTKICSEPEKYISDSCVIHQINSRCWAMRNFGADIRQNIVQQYAVSGIGSMETDDLLVFYNTDKGPNSQANLWPRSLESFTSETGFDLRGRTLSFHDPAGPLGLNVQINCGNMTSSQCEQAYELKYPQPLVAYGFNEWKVAQRRDMNPLIDGPLNGRYMGDRETPAQWLERNGFRQMNDKIITFNDGRRVNVGRDGCNRPNARNIFKSFMDTSIRLPGSRVIFFNQHDVNRFITGNGSGSCRQVQGGDQEDVRVVRSSDWSLRGDIVCSSSRTCRNRDVHSWYNVNQEQADTNLSRNNGVVWNRVPGFYGSSSQIQLTMPTIRLHEMDCSKSIIFRSPRNFDGALTLCGERADIFINEFVPPVDASPDIVAQPNVDGKNCGARRGPLRLGAPRV